MLIIQIFDTGKRPELHVNGITDECSIAELFAQHFAKVCTSNSKEGAARLKPDEIRIL